MEKSILAFVILGFCSILVDSQGIVDVPVGPSFGTPPPPPPSPSPPPPPRYSQPPRPPPRTLTPPRSQMPSHPPPASPNPPFQRPNSPPQSKKNETLPSETNHNVQKKAERVHVTLGKKIGLLFAGIAGALQICVVVFLGMKRHQLFKIKDRYETCS